MTTPQGTDQAQAPGNAEVVHDAALWARSVGFDQLGLALDVVAGELGYTPAGESSALPTVSGAPATA